MNNPSLVNWYLDHLVRGKREDFVRVFGTDDEVVLRSEAKSVLEDMKAEDEDGVRVLYVETEGRISDPSVEIGWRRLATTDHQSFQHRGKESYVRLVTPLGRSCLELYKRFSELDKKVKGGSD